jgi:hypothetical protein
MDIDMPRPPLALIIATEALLTALFVAGLAAISMLPGFSADAAETLPEFAGLRTPLLTVAIVFSILGLAALATVALLVLRVYNGTVLTRPSLRWVDGLVAALAAAVVLIIVSFVLVSNGQAGSPFIALSQVMAALTLVALACVTLVLRALLRRAIALRAELDEVV